MGDAPEILAQMRAAADGDIVFNRDIRPILSEHCYPCHGPDANKLKGYLRFDVHSGQVDRYFAGPAHALQEVSFVPRASGRGLTAGPCAAGRG